MQIVELRAVHALQHLLLMRWVPTVAMTGLGLAARAASKVKVNQKILTKLTFLI